MSGLLGLAQLREIITQMTPEQREAMVRETSHLPRKIWTPQEGPQETAYYSDADLLLYGGAAGGGKSALMTGLAVNEHTRVAVFRQQVGELQGFMDYMDSVLRTAGHKPISRQANQWIGPGSRKIEFGHLERPNSELSWQGRDHDLKLFDEAAQIAPAKIIYVINWLRTAREGQRCRVVLASNPPMAGVGDYLIEWFAPWVDPTHPLYGTVKPGELLWAYFDGVGDNARTVWVDKPGKAELHELHTKAEQYMRDGNHEELAKLRIPKSRTFVPATLKDNKYLGTDYLATLMATPEPLRTALLTGNFFAARKDQAFQVIPSAWITLAEERWKERYSAAKRMTHVEVDIAEGGADNHVIGAMRDRDYDPLKVTPGTEVPDGMLSVAEVLGVRRDDATIGVDCTGGWGGSTRDLLKTHHDITVIPFVASQASGKGSRDGSLQYLNSRTEVWWDFREAMDPDRNHPDEMPAFPPDPALRAELSMPTWKPRANKVIQIESKEDIKKRLHRSTDRADVVVTGWKNRNAHLLEGATRHNKRYRARDLDDPHQTLRSRHTAREMRDPHA